LISRFVFRADWPIRVDWNRPAGKFFINRPWRGPGWLWIGPWVIGSVRRWQDWRKSQQSFPD
jgi:hypothetical protein